MNKLLFFIIMLFSALCHAQTGSQTLTISCSEAIEIGLKNRFDVKAQQFDGQIAATRVKQAKGEWLPEIGIDGNIKYSPQVEKSVIQGGLLPGFDQTMQIPLTVKSQSIFGINLNQPIFNASLSNNTRLAKNQLEKQLEQNKEARINIILQISQTYFNVILKELQAKIATDIASRNLEYMQLVEGMLKNGLVVENQYQRTTLDFENATQLRKQANQNYELSLMELRYQLNLPEGTEIKTTGSLDYAMGDIVELNEKERTEIRQLRLSQQENLLNLKKYQQNSLPSISIGANYSQQFSSNNFSYSDGTWRSPFSYVSLDIHIPISAHYKNKVFIAEFKTKAQQNGLLLSQKTADINYEIHQTRTAVANAILNLKNAKDSYELSKTIFHNQQQQYRLGSFEYSELLDTEKSLSTTERNYIQSVYELMIAQLNLKKATNNL